MNEGINEHNKLELLLIRC